LCCHHSPLNRGLGRLKTHKWRTEAERRRDRKTTRTWGKKWWKNFDERSHSGGGKKIFHRDSIMWHISVLSSAFGFHYWGLIDAFCCIHCNGESKCFSMGRTTHKIAPFRGVCQPPSNTWCLGPSRVSCRSSIPTGSAILAGLTNVTSRQTDRHTDANKPHYSVSSNGCGLKMKSLRLWSGTSGIPHLLSTGTQ